MIDVESQIYTPIAVALRETFPGIDVSGEYVKACLLYTSPSPRDS